MYPYIILTLVKSLSRPMSIFIHCKPSGTRTTAFDFFNPFGSGTQIIIVILQESLETRPTETLIQVQHTVSLNNMGVNTAGM